MKESQKIKIIIAGGGTGGHIFPALSIGEALLKLNPNVELLFVGALGKMEMEKVPLAGHKIIGLPVAGFQRKFTLQNFLFPFKLISSITKAFSVINSFKPNICIGVGGYASGPVLQVANWMKIKTVIQEQNSYPGVTNKILAKQASKIFTAFENMDEYLPKNKVILAGNPIRESIRDIQISQHDAKSKFQLNPNKKVLLITGGSLGSAVINKSIFNCLDQLIQKDIQVIWQTGKAYLNKYIHLQSEENGIIVTDFIPAMDKAYAAADIIVSRAGGTISELACVGKPCILLPSPNVAEDHQTKNVLALVQKDAAILVKDSEAEFKLCTSIFDLIENKDLCLSLSTNIKMLAKPDASITIAHEILKLCKV